MAYRFVALGILTAAFCFRCGAASASSGFTNQTSDPNAPLTSNGVTSLMRAAKRGNLGEVDRLLAAGARVNAATNGLPHGEHFTAVAVAAQEGHRAVVRRLLRAGAQVNPTVPGDAAPLVVAAQHGRRDIVRDLAAAGADLNYRGLRFKQTALTYAAGQGRVRMVRFLLSRGPRVDVRDSHGMTALMYAAGAGRLACVELLLKAQADVNAWSEPADMTPLKMAVLHGHQDVVRRLLRAGADPNGGREPEGSALSLAREAARDDLVRILLAAGAKE